MEYPVPFSFSIAELKMHAVISLLCAVLVTPAQCIEADGSALDNSARQDVMEAKIDELNNIVLRQQDMLGNLMKKGGFTKVASF